MDQSIVTQNFVGERVINDDAVFIGDHEVSYDKLVALKDICEEIEEDTWETDDLNFAVKILSARKVGDSLNNPFPIPGPTVICTFKYAHILSKLRCNSEPTPEKDDPKGPEFREQLDAAFNRIEELFENADDPNMRFLPDYRQALTVYATHHLLSRQENFTNLKKTLDNISLLLTTNRDDDIYTLVLSVTILIKHLFHYCVYSTIFNNSLGTGDEDIAVQSLSWQSAYDSLGLTENSPIFCNLRGVRNQDTCDVINQLERWVWAFSVMAIIESNSCPCEKRVVNCENCGTMFTINVIQSDDESEGEDAMEIDTEPATRQVGSGVDISEDTTGDQNMDTKSSRDIDIDKWARFIYEVPGNLHLFANYPFACTVPIAALAELIKKM